MVLHQFRACKRRRNLPTDAGTPGASNASAGHRAGPGHKEDKMGGMRLAGIVLIVLGALALAYGGFSYTRENTVAKLGPVEIKAEQRERVNVPLWAGIAAIVGGGAMLLVGARRP